MNAEDEIRRLECIKKTIQENKPFALAVQSIHALRVERIFTKGLNSNNSPIGEYSNEPIYVSTIDKTKSPKKLGTPTGKHGQSKFQSGKPHTSKYFPGGYFQFRVAIGRNANFVNLKLFGNLFSNFANGSRYSRSDKLIDNVAPKPNKVSVNEYNVGLDAENSKKKEGLEDRYGKIFEHTAEEKKMFPEILGTELHNSIKNCG